MDFQKRTIRPYPAIAPAPAATRSAEPREHEWEIALFGQLDDKQHELMSQLIELPRRSRGTIFFDSSGGSAYVGLALASLIRLRGLKATAVVAGECSSAAILPFAACEERYVTPHSTLLFHPIRWQSDEDVRLEEAAEWARHFQILEEDLDQLISRLFGLSPQQLRQWTRPGRFISGQEIVDIGLAKMVNLFSGDLWSQITAARRSEDSAG